MDSLQAATVKVTLTPVLMELLTNVGKITHTTWRAAFDRLLLQIELHTRYGTLNIGPEWVDAMKVMLDKPLSEEIHIDFDVSLLETSKNRAGYAGVYGTGSSFRALVPDPATGGTKYLPSRATALDAAIERYHYFEKHGIPYGNLGRIVAGHRAIHPEWSVEEALQAALLALNGAEESSGLKDYYTRTQVVELLERRGLKASPSEITSPDRGPDLSRCSVCGQPFKDSDNPTFGSEPDTLVHRHCVNLNEGDA